MKLASWPAGVVVLLLAAGGEASDWVGIYAVVDRVVLDPPGGSGPPPERVQIWGAFSLATEGPGAVESGDSGFYDLPIRGYLYYHVPPGMEEVARIEWSDLEEVAGTGQCIALGSRYQPRGRIRSARERPALPDLYPLNIGLVKVPVDTQNPPPRNLFWLPAPLSPVDGGSVEDGTLVLVVGNVLDPLRAGAHYQFEIRNGSGAVEWSPKLEPGEGQTRWTPMMAVEPHRDYHWRVRGMEGEWVGPWAGASFIPYFIRGDASGDGLVNVADPVALLSFSFLGGRNPPLPFEAGDVDDSGRLDVGDPIQLLTHLFLGGPPPAQPYPEAGPKPAW